MVSAVLMKRAKLNLNNQDIHLNIVGGFKIKEPAIDLAAALSIYSALKDRAIPKDTVVIGEIGLAGEIRPIFNIEKRVAEAQKLGFKNIIIPIATLSKKYDINIRQVKEINEVMAI